VNLAARASAGGLVKSNDKKRARLEAPRAPAGPRVPGKELVNTGWFSADKWRDCWSNISTSGAAAGDAAQVNDFLLVLVVITALCFDFTNGFHDTGNAMATSIATQALSPRVAVALSGVMNLVGAFLSLAVAATIASGLVDTNVVTLPVVAACLAGGITWNLLTWLFGIP